MKVDKIILEEQDRFNIVAEIPAKTEKSLGNIIPFKGHTMFEINCTTGEITTAEFEEIVAEVTGGIRKKIITKENCLYISCLNKKVAKKKFLKWIIEKREQQKKQSYPKG